MPKDDLQEKIMTFRFLESRLENLSRQREGVMNRISEVDSTLASLNEIEKVDGDSLFPVGSSAFVFGKITDKKKMIVEIGSGIALEKDFEDGKKTLEKNKTELENVLKEIEKEISNTSSMLEQLAPEIESMSGKNG